MNNLFTAIMTFAICMVVFGTTLPHLVKRDIYANCMQYNTQLTVAQAQTMCDKIVKGN